MASRRQFLTHTLAGATLAAGTVTLLPFAARAMKHASDVFETKVGKFTVHPVSHASFVMETPLGTIFVDPVGAAPVYTQFPEADLVLITHQHGDHFSDETLKGVVREKTQMITNPAVHGMLADDMKAKAKPIANGEQTTFNGITIDAIPAHNLTEERMKFHPPGRDNGYVLTFGGSGGGEGEETFRVYISGDTEDVAEMRALKNIDLAFVCMNLPFTMEAETAADAVNEFKPAAVYPYHYRGRDGGTQDPAVFAGLVNGSEVKMGEWYS